MRLDPSTIPHWVALVAGTRACTAVSKVAAAEKAGADAVIIFSPEDALEGERLGRIRTAPGTAQFACQALGVTALRCPAAPVVLSRQPGDPLDVSIPAVSVALSSGTSLQGIVEGAPVDVVIHSAVLPLLLPMISSALAGVVAVFAVLALCHAAQSVRVRRTPSGRAFRLLVGEGEALEVGVSGAGGMQGDSSSHWVTLADEHCLEHCRRTSTCCRSWCITGTRRSCDDSRTTWASATREPGSERAPPAAACRLPHTGGAGMPQGSLCTPAMPAPGRCPRLWRRRVRRRSRRWRAGPTAPAMWRGGRGPAWVRGPG